MKYDTAILGAGASGLMCAITCAQRGRRVVLIDHAKQAGRKIRVSGGGRCNVTNTDVCAQDFTCANPHFVKSALARFTPWDIIDALEQKGCKTTHEDDGKVFCAMGADTVAEMLIQEASRLGATFRYETTIHNVRREQDIFAVETDKGLVRAKNVVVATGGLAWPQIGATDVGHSIARSFGLKVTNLRPGLVPFLAPRNLISFCRSLSGISLPVRMTLENGTKRPPCVQGDMLFTHKGISGPVVLDASLLWKKDTPLSIDFLPGVDIAEKLAHSPRMELKNNLATLLPKRLAEELCLLHKWTGTYAQLPHKELHALEETTHNFPFTPPRTEGHAKAEVTLGGVRTDQFSSKTMECTSVPGLYFTGEVLDVTGRLGGFNLQWAWASGYAAGQYA